MGLLISLIAAVMVGLVSKVFLSTPLAGADVEKVFLVMNEELFPPICGRSRMVRRTGSHHEYCFRAVIGNGLFRFTGLV